MVNVSSIFIVSYIVIYYNSFEERCRFVYKFIDL